MVKFYSLLLVSIIVVLTSCSTEPKIAHDDKNNTQAIDIPFERYTLDNGLTVLIHEDHSDPVAHVDVTYHVGSAREELGRSGFAHLFEHMMFQGSENVADEEHIKLVTEAGGTMNGTTNRDRTNYFETVPVNHLETMLWLEADRMGFFLEGITQEKFEVQRATVKNEKAQRYDNAAYGRVWELISKSLYPHGHPYSWLTIGDLEDLDNATAQDLRNFFLRWYGPNNATLTIGGDINAKAVMALVEKYFGSIARGPEVKPLDIAPVALDQNRYVSYYDDKIQFPAVTFSFPTVANFHPDSPALDCLASILGHGKDSYLFQNLVASQKAVNASASHSNYEHAGEFFMFVMPFPGKPLPEFEDELRASLLEFEHAGVSDEDIQKYKAQFERGMINTLEKVSGKVSELAHLETFAGDAAQFAVVNTRNLAVTKDDVMRVYEQYIKNKPAVILSVLADPEGTPAKPNNFSSGKNTTTDAENPYPTVDYSGLSYNKAEDSFDRSVKPAPLAAKPVSPPEFWRHSSKNGIEIIGSQQTALPKIALSLSLKGGVFTDSLHLETLGLSSITAAMMNTSTKNYSEQEIAKELEKIGSSISFSAHSDETVISVSSLSKHIDRTLELLKERLFSPAFEQNDLNRIIKQSIESAEAQTKQASSIAPMVYNRITYSDKDIRGIPDTRLMKTLPNISTEDLENYYSNFYSPIGASMVVVGDINKKTLLKKLNFVFEWKANTAAKAVFGTPPTISETTLYFVNKTAAAQSEIRVGYLTDLKKDLTGEYFKAGLMNFALGGAFNSRINLNLREDKGITYGARSGFSSSELPGPYTVSTSVKADSTDLAVSEIMRELALYAKDGIKEGELELMRNSVAQRDALKYESSSQKIRFLHTLQKYKADKNFSDQQKSIIESIKADEINTIAKAMLPIKKLNILVVGDKATTFKKLQELGYPIVELDVEGEKIQ
ncbi:MAG: zinc protease [Flavobacteriales bacterium]|jgi:zinc protease